MKLLYIDLFCGAGGTSTGVESARFCERNCCMVIACVNHDRNAIASHVANHPGAMHFTEDIRTLDLAPLVAHLAAMRREHPDAFVVLWASLECTNFSKAKGGQPRDADSRTLAEHLFRYIDALNPDFIQIENVEEFMSWGDLDENGKPISKDAGRLYEQWKWNVQAMGYRFDHRILNSADFGAYTSRRRFFGQFARPELPLAWPEPTHTKGGDKGLFGPLKPWRPVREVLDFNDEGESIFGRPRPLVDATLERIYAGLIKFVAGGKDAFLIKYNSVNGKTGKHIPPSIDDPCPVVSTQNRLGLANVHFLAKHFSGRPEGKVVSIDQPAGAITVIDHHSFISAYYGNGFNSSVSDPAPTITTKDRFQYVRPCFITSQFSGGGQVSSVDAPGPALLAKPKQHIVICQPWVMNTNFGNVGSTIDDPAPVLTANRKYHYLMNPQYASAGGSVDNPCFTLIARMDKMPPYLVATEAGGVAIRIEDTDTPAMVKIKEFMALYGIVDIKMRMLRIPELKQIMGFPKDYILIGSQTDQKKFIGNAVEVGTARALAEALVAKLYELNLTPQLSA